MTINVDNFVSQVLDYKQLKYLEYIYIIYKIPLYNGGADLQSI